MGLDLSLEEQGVLEGLLAFCEQMVPGKALGCLRQAVFPAEVPAHNPGAARRSLTLGD